MTLLDAIEDPGALRPVVHTRSVVAGLAGVSGRVLRMAYADDPALLEELERELRVRRVQLLDALLAAQTEERRRRETAGALDERTIRQIRHETAEPVNKNETAGS